jgi:cyclophilin family peptidyl-prolyl cis-trans isomerase
MDSLDSARRSVSARSTLCWDRGLERLEPRVLLSNTPLPDLDDMEDRNNTVVRMETEFGTIDLEMFDVAGPDGGSAAPNTVANFLDRIRQGDYDLSFFHRYAKYQNGNPFVLQGGGFKFDDDLGLSAVEERERIENEFAPDRSNLARTIAMARLGGDEDSASSQWFFNLRNANANSLDNDGTVPGPDDGYCVFGRVLNQDSWDVILDITSLTTHSYVDQTDPLTGALGEVPTRDDLTDVTPPPDIESAQLIDISNVEIIKAANTSLFYRARSAYPEGFRGPGTIENIQLVNPSADVEIYYQVIVRYERGLGRDQVISTGTLAPNVHLDVRVNDFNDPTLDLVLEEAPYGYEVQATGPIGASLHRFDFGADTSESFINLDNASASQLQTWAFGGTGTTIEAPNDNQIVRRPFLVWTNLGFEPAEVTITFTLQTGGRVVWTRTTEPLRRDGLEVFNLKNITRDIASIRVEADQKIVAAFSVYDTIVDPALVFPPLSANNGFTSAGVINGGLTQGALAGARIGAEGTSYVSFVNHNNAQASVTLTFMRDGQADQTAPLIVPARGRAFYNLRNADIPEGEMFTIRYHSPLIAVSAEYISTLNGDTVSTPFATFGSSQAIFAGGSYDPTNADESELISIYNPYVNKAVEVNISFHFADDKIQGVSQFDLGARGRTDISVASLAAIVAKINSGAQFASYSIVITVTLEGDGTGGGSIGAAGVVTQLTRFNMTSAITSNASLFQLTLPLDSPSYNAA